LRISGIFARLAAVRHRSSKYRLAALAAAAILGIFALILGLSLLGAVFGIKGFNPSFGLFFSQAYGILAFFIPIFLGYAASILADSRWRPDRFFILIASLFPFLTLTLGFICIRDFEALSLDYAFLELTGRTGFGLIIVVLALLEVTAIQMLRNALFPYVTQDGIKRRMWRGITSGADTGGTKAGKLSLPPPPNINATADSIGINPGDFGEWIHSAVHAPNDLRAGARASSEGGLKNFDLDLPAMRPLNSPLALEYLSGGLAEQEEHRVESEKIAIDSVERALEEAELLAAIHSEQARKKPTSHPAHHARKKYHVPVEILNQYPDGEYWIIDQATRDAAVTLKETLEEFKIQAEVTGIRKGPVITMFEILPAPGVKLSRIVNLQDNIALRLAASSVRIVAPIPGKHAVGIEVPNARRNIVSFREIIESELQREGKRPEIPVVMGKDISGEAQTIDLTQTPHLLIAGATGAGKSVCVNTIILSILYQLAPSDCRLILIDPKIVELKLYNDIPHLMTPVITEPKKAFQALQYCIYEMERRYACLDSMGVRDIRNYNKRIKERNIAQEYMPYIVIIIDEFADLMATTGKELESTVARLCAMSRAVGIHLVLATQRPSIDVITGLIKANIPSRIAFMVASKMDSRIIIDMVGAEKLLGKGDMLYAGVVDPFPIRMQGAFVSEEEVETVVEHVKTLGEPDYIDEEIFYDDEEEEVDASLFSDGNDPLYEKALEIVLQQGKASASFIQRRLKIGYNRAARLVEEMEHKGVVGPAQGSKPRELLRGV